MEESMKTVIDGELKKVPFWKRNSRKREMIENIDAKIISLGEEWENNDQSLQDIKAEIADQIEEIDFQINDGMEQCYEIQQELNDILAKIVDTEELDEKVKLGMERKNLMDKHEGLMNAIAKLKDKKLLLLTKVADAEKEFEQKRGYIAANLRGLVETRTILEKPKEIPKWAERIPGELLKGLVAGGLLIVGLVVKEKMMDDGTSDKNTEYFVNNIGKVI